MTDPNLPPVGPNDANQPAAPAYNPAPAYGSAPAYSQAPAPQQYGTQQYGAPAPAEKYNVLAIVSLVSAFFVSLVAIVTGHIALSQIKRTGEKGRGLALAGVIIGYVSIAISIVILLAMIPFFIMVANNPEMYSNEIYSN